MHTVQLFAVQYFVCLQFIITGNLWVLTFILVEIDLLLELPMILWKWNLLLCFYFEAVLAYLYHSGKSNRV